MRLVRGRLVLVGEGVHCRSLWSDVRPMWAGSRSGYVITRRVADMGGKRVWRALRRLMEL